MFPGIEGAKRGRIRVDGATIAGFAVAAACIAGGLILEGGRVVDIAQVTAALIVFGGTVGAVLVTTPHETFLSALRRSGELLIRRTPPFQETLEKLVELSEYARRNGLPSLESAAHYSNDRFLCKALHLAADGTDQRQIREIMLLEMDRKAERADAETKVWESAAGYAPTVGIMGAVLGLIQVMKHLENLDDVGRGIAVAFVATVYGVAAANLLFLPAAGKLRARSREQEQLNEMTLEGVLAIAEGMNPTLMRIKLEAFVDSPETTSKGSSARAKAGPRTAEEFSMARN